MRTYHRPVGAEDAAVLARARRQLLGAGEDAFLVYEWGAEGPTALILHGWGSSAARFTRLAQALQDSGWRVLALDAPGHGASPGKSSSLPQFMASLDATAAHYGRPNALIGHSLGALAIACHHGSGVPDWASEVRAAVLISMPSGAEFLLGRFIDLLGLSVKTQALLRQRFDARFHAQPADYASLPGAARITAPVLLVHDRGDDVVPYEHSAELCAQLRNAQLLTTEGLGHSDLTRDAATIQHIVEFIA
jgi:pimeloyl-ACP methyl ester carboxylesterase